MIAQKKVKLKKSPSPIQVFPHLTLQLMEKMYLNVCNLCRDEPQMSENHILQEHGYHIDLKDLIMRYQVKQERKRINTIIKEAIKLLDGRVKKMAKLIQKKETV